MKHILLIILTLTYLHPTSLRAQFAKQTIDEELLSGLVQAKQEEVRTRVLTNFITKNLPEANHATYNTLADLLDILTTEKNKGAMTRDLVSVVSEYAIAYGVTWYVITNKADSTAYRICHKAGYFDTPDTLPFPEWRQLRDAVRRSGSGGSDKGAKSAVTGSTDADKRRIEFHDWLLDTTMAILRDPSQVDTAFARQLRERGLFTRSKQRSWQGSAGKWHSSFMQNDSADIAVLSLALKKQMKALLNTTEKFQRLGTAVGMLHAERLRELQITTLAGNDGTGSSVTQGGAVQNEMVAAIFDLFRHATEIYRFSNTENRFISRLSDIVNRYVILDETQFSENERFGFKIDVEGIILALEDKVIEGHSPTRNCWFNVRPYFTIGLNYGAYREETLDFETGAIRSVPTIAWAGEKLGLKWRLWDWRYTHSREANEVFHYRGKNFKRYVRPTIPAVSNCYLNVFASGLLYSVADLRTESSYDGVLFGAGGGLTIFNDLEVNVSYVTPLLATNDLQANINAGFWNLGLDIPIFQYIRAAREKRAK